MGEYAALAAAGCIRDFETALSLVRKRGAYMEEAGSDAEGRPRGGMMALFGERRAALECIGAARGDGILEAVNFNAPAQLVAAGDNAALARLREAARGQGGIKALPLSVSTAFHSAMMAPAAEKLAEALREVDLAAPKIPVYSNLTGRSLMEGRPPGLSEAAWIRCRLALQAQKPVLWQETIENMIEDGVEFFIEVGPGRTLSGLVRKTRPDFGVTVNVEDAESLEACVEEIRKFA
jgi:[acyl-carrier-protein] S-malonyltransferase